LGYNLYARHPQWILRKWKGIAARSRSRYPKMAGTSHEEHDKEELEAAFTWLEQRIASLTEMVTQPLVMKGKERHSAETEHEEEKADPKIPKGRNMETQVIKALFLHLPIFHLRLKQNLKYQFMMVI
jgi:hypothetical protein